MENEYLEETFEVSQEFVTEEDSSPGAETTQEDLEASADSIEDDSEVTGDFIEGDQESAVDSIEDDSEASGDFTEGDQEDAADSIDEDSEAATDTLEESIDSGTSFTPENLETAFYNALEKWTEEGTGQIIVQYYAPGIDKELDKFSLTEICLVFIVLILLAGSILKIIGGRAHE